MGKTYPQKPGTWGYVRSLPYARTSLLRGQRSEEKDPGRTSPEVPR